MIGWHRFVPSWCVTKQDLASLEARLVHRLRDVLDALTAIHHAAAPALATVTVLCEVWQHGIARDSGFVGGGVPHHADAGHWVPSVLGAEGFMFEGASLDLQIIPQRPTRNFRWFVSGHPEIVCEAFIVGNEHGNAGYGGTKYGEFQTECRIGNRITVRLERKRVPS